jgi:hyperosmotically inducible protein
MPGLSEPGAARPLKDPIPVSEASDSAMSAKEDTRLRAAPTAWPFGADYDGFNHPVPRRPHPAAKVTCQRERSPTMHATSLRAAAIAALATLALAACDREPGDRTVGQKLDNAIDRTQQKLAQAGEKTSEKLAEAGDKTQLALANAADKVVQKTGEAVATVNETAVAPVANSAAETGKAMTDAAITASIKTDFLKDPDLSVLKIDVDTKSGVVTLNGLAGDEAARSRAEKMAGAIKGVKEVRNFLVVKRA